jgi:hypothetical protein
VTNLFLCREDDKNQSLVHCHSWGILTVVDGAFRLSPITTGTGKTVIAFQICYKLWNSRWNRTGEHRRPRILYLADRNVLVEAWQ